MSDRRALYVAGRRGASPGRALQSREGEKTSFATYFGAFPAAYWADRTPIERVRLAMSATGPADVIVRSTDASGAVSTLARVDAIDGDWHYEVAIGRGQRVAVVRGHRTLGDAPGYAMCGGRFPCSPSAEVSLTVCITTFDREPDCIRLLGRIAGDADAIARIDRIVVADQGSRRLRDADGFTAVSRALGRPAARRRASRTSAAPVDSAAA